jgi:hypothetical protein
MERRRREEEEDGERRLKEESRVVRVAERTGLAGEAR